MATSARLAFSGGSVVVTAEVVFEAEVAVVAAVVRSVYSGFPDVPESSATTDGATIVVAVAAAEEGGASAGNLWVR